LCNGLLLRRILNRLFELCSWNVRIFGIFKQLHKLSYWDLSEHNWCHSMLSVSCGIVLRHHGTECTDGVLRRGYIFSCLCDNVLKLFEWGISGLYRIFSLYSMPSRIVLRHHRPLSSDGLLRCGLLLGRFLNGLFELFVWNIQIYKKQSYC
jgi:hypothetical protein